jgi:hypothetical protein
MTYGKLITDELPSRGRPRSKAPRKKVSLRLPEMTYRDISTAADYSGRTVTEMLLAAWETYKLDQKRLGRWPPLPDHGRFDEADHISRVNMRDKLAEAEGERHRLKDHPFWGNIKK